MPRVYFGFLTMEAGAAAVALLAALTRELGVPNALCKKLLPREKGWGRHSPEQAQAVAFPALPSALPLPPRIRLDQPRSGWRAEWVLLFASPPPQLARLD